MELKHDLAAPLIVLKNFLIKTKEEGTQDPVNIELAIEALLRIECTVDEYEQVKGENTRIRQ